MNSFSALTGGTGRAGLPESECKGSNFRANRQILRRIFSGGNSDKDTEFFPEERNRTHGQPRTAGSNSPALTARGRDTAGGKPRQGTAATVPHTQGRHRGTPLSPRHGAADIPPHPQEWQRRTQGPAHRLRRPCARTATLLRKKAHAFAHKRELPCARTPAPLRKNTDGSGQRQKRPRDKSARTQTMIRKNAG